MTEVTRAYYERYWSVEAPPPLSDPLSGTRLSILRAGLDGAESLRILEVGCGAGAALAALAGDGHRATGMDVAVGALAHAHRTAPAAELVCHAVEALPWPVEPAAYDVVTSFEVIEHLLEPRSLLEGARAALAPAGRLALSTPYHGVVKNVAIALTAFEKHFAVEGDHVRFFTDRALSALLFDTGFEVERIRHYGRFAPLWAGTFVWARKR